MKEAPIISKNGKIDPIHSKMYLSDFSSPVKRSHIDLRKSEAEDEVTCQLCQKIFNFDAFRNHIDQHRRKPREKIPTLEQLYQQSYSHLSDNSEATRIKFKEARSIEVRTDDKGDSKDSFSQLSLSPSAQSVQRRISDNLVKSPLSAGNIRMKN